MERKIFIVALTGVIMIGLFYMAYLLGRGLGSVHSLAPYAVLLGRQVYIAAKNPDNVPHIIGSIIGLIIIGLVPYEWACFMVGSLLVFPTFLYLIKKRKSNQK